MFLQAVILLQAGVELRQQEVDKAAVRLCNEAIKANKCGAAALLRCCL